VEQDAVQRFPQYVDDVIALMSPEGVGIRIGADVHPLHATPRAVSTPDVWLLGSSDYSARLAAERGLPYVFAHHFSGRGTAAALDLYRSGYTPSAAHPLPRTFLTVNVVVAPTQAEAERLALPNLASMVALRSGGPLAPQLLVEQAEESGIADAHQSLATEMRQRWVVGTPATVADQLAALAAEFGVDEVMVHPVAGAVLGTPAHRAPAREATLALLAEAFGQQAA
jgi:luciferase family oxidoreductase group 1